MAMWMHGEADTWVAMLRPDEATQQQPYCSEKMCVILGDGIDDEPTMC